MFVFEVLVMQCIYWLLLQPVEKNEDSTAGSEDFL
jgi:hypothetical protein